MNETTNKTIAEGANEKNEMQKSIFDDELFDDVSSYDQNELHCGIGIPMEFSFYDAQKRCFFEKILDAPKDKDYAVLAFDWKEHRVEFYGMYRLCPIESSMQHRVVMKLTDDTYTIK